MPPAPEEETEEEAAQRNADHEQRMAEYKAEQERKEEERKAFLSSLLENIAEDRDALTTLADRRGVGTSRLKELAAWVGEKLTQIKLGSADSVSFEIVEALELVELGIRGKLQLWHALLLTSSTDERLRGVDYISQSSSSNTSFNAMLPPLNTMLPAS